MGPAGALLAGSMEDNHGDGQVQICRDTGAGTVCDWATTLMTTLAPTNTASVYDDVPATPVDIIPTTYCGGGEITRFFNVTDDFIAGNMELGFNAIHPNRAEIVAELVSPAGTRVRVIGPSGTMYGFANDDVWLSDAAVGSLHVSSDDDPTEPYYDRLARPDTPLSAFNGEAAVGVWQLRICDANPLLNDGTYARSRLSLTPQGAALSTAGTWAYALPTLAGADGLTQTLSIYGMDDVGNRTTSAISLTYQLDVVPPALTVTTIITRRQQLFPLMVLAGQVSDGSGLNEVYVRVDSPEGASYRDAVSRSGAYWGYTLQPATPGIYTLWLAAYDVVGNVTTMGPYQVQASTHWLYLPVVMHESSGETGANLIYLPQLTR
ncbi:MAG: proprotein convertase P-domain-containing protein [Chloroflexi bacterium]|nr:proprotein convertase P-domain-containing protein [Chloroflexota bacterium]